MRDKLYLAISAVILLLVILVISPPESQGAECFECPHGNIFNFPEGALCYWAEGPGGVPVPTLCQSTPPVFQSPIAPLSRYDVYIPIVAR